MNGHARALALVAIVVATWSYAQNPVPAVTLGVPAETMIGEPFTFTATFDNTSATTTGYGPFIDLVFPVTGADGAGAATDDGIGFAGATYLGAPVTSVQLTFPAGAAPTCVSHPYAVNTAGAPLQVCGTPGDTLVVLQLPFGSFTNDQPPAEVVIAATTSNLADLGVPLPIAARAGFQYGATPLADPATDPSILSDAAADSGAWSVRQSVTPVLLRLAKTYLGPEDETATGPNYPRQFLLAVDIADGQTITDLDISDLLPGNLQFLQVDETRVNGVLTGTTAIATPSTSAPGGTLTRRFAAVAGTAGSADATLLYTFYVPRDDASLARVVDPASGDDVLSVDDARAEGDWVPVDGRDGSVHAASDATAADHTLTDKSVAIQKAVAVVADTGAPGPSPGDTLEYTLAFQVSDFFTFSNLVVVDVFSDGQRWDAGFAPTLAVDEHGASTAGAFAPGNVTVVLDSPGTGGTTVTFAVSAELVARALDGVLTGGCVPAGGGEPPNAAACPFGGTTGTIVFRTVIQEQFSDTYPSGDPSVDQGDTLDNGVTIGGDVLDNATQAPTGFAEQDDSGVAVAIVTGALAKSIYAVNGATSFPVPVRIAPGDTVTYRILYTLPTSDVEDMRFIDYLPLPVLYATQLTAFDDVVDAAVPAAGRAKFGPTDTFRAYSGIVPTLAADATANSVTFTYGDFDDTSNTPTVVDILFTVAASADPFADGLFLTNQVRAQEGTTNAGDQTADAIVQIQLTEPVLRVAKGVVASDKAGATFTPPVVGPAAFSAPGGGCPRFTTPPPLGSAALAAAPINSNVSGLDAGDIVTLAIVIENTGSGLTGAFDVRVRDTLPAGFAIPSGGLNLCVANGAGTLIPYTSLGTGLFDASGGIELTDGAGAGALAAYDATSGANIAVVTFDLQLQASVSANQTLTDTATLFNYAGDEGGGDHTAADATDTAAVNTAVPATTKYLVATSEGHTGYVAPRERVTIGEIVRYRLIARVPEGTFANFQLRDLLPAGLTFLDDDTARLGFVSNGAGFASSATGSVPAVSPASCTTSGSAADGATPASSALTCTLADFNVGSSNSTASDPDAFATTGTDPYFKLGDLVNGDSDADAEFVVIEFNALVDNNNNSAADRNDAGETKNNSARVTVGGTQVGSDATNVPAGIVEPSLALAKAIMGAAPADAGDTVSYRLTITAASGNDRSTAYDVVVTDTLPPVLQRTGSVVVTPSTGVTDSSTASALSVTIASIAPGASVTIDYQATLLAAVAPNQVVTNTAALTFTSVPGTGTCSNGTGSCTPGASGAADGERDGSGGVGGVPNGYARAAQQSFTAANVAPVKSVVATSEAHTTDSPLQLAIGEIVRYRLAVTLPEGTSTALALVDALPADLAYMAGTAQVSFVADADVTEAADLAGADNDAVPPTFDLPDARVTAGAGQVTFALGTVINNDSDAGAESVVLEFNALVVNDAASNAGDTESNSFTVQVNAVNLATSNTVSGTLVEPSITDVAKSASPTAGDAGDEITYTVTYTNEAGATAATAFEVRLTDTLPAGLTLLPASVTVTPNTGVTDASAGNTVDVTVASVAPGGSVSVEYKATLAAGVAPNQAITNTAAVTYTSLPGGGTAANSTGSQTPGVSGAADGERDGSGSPASNDYSDADPATVTVNGASFAKALDATSAGNTDDADVAIGEVLTYALTVTLPEGKVTTARVVDDLPAGLAYVAGSVAVDTSGFAGSVPAPTVTASGGDGGEVTVDFGQITVTDDNDAANNSFIVRLQAVVLDDADNQAGRTLANAATLAVDGGTAIPAGPVVATVVEPDLSVSKAPDDASAAFGQEILYTITVAHTLASGAAAQDVVVTDTIPAGLTYVAGSAGAPAGWTAGFAGTTVTFSAASFPLVPGTAALTYRAVVEGPGTVALRDVLTNAVTAVWTSLPGSVGGERTGGGGVDDYRRTTSADVTVTGPDLVIGKDDGGVTAGAGGVVQYTLTYENQGNGEAAGVSLAETVPAATTFNASVSTAGWTCVPDGDPGAACTFVVGTLAAGAAGSAVFAVNVANPVPEGVEELSNTASVADDGTHGTDPTPQNNSDGDTTPVGAAPSLSATKTDAVVVGGGDGAANPGDIIEYTIVITNAGDQTVVGVTLTDTPDDTTRLVPGSVTTTQGAVTGGNAGVPPVTVAIGALPGNGGAATVRYRVTIAPLPAGVGQVANQGVVSATGEIDVPTDDPETSDPNDETATPVTAAPDLTLAKSDGGAVLTPAGAVGYTLTYENVGDQEATGVVITETVPPVTAFVDAASTPGWSCVPDASAGSTCTFAVGSLAAGAGGSVVFAVALVMPDAQGTAAVANTASIADDGANGDDPTANNVGTDETPVQIAVPALGGAGRLAFLLALLALGWAVLRRQG